MKLSEEGSLHNKDTKYNQLKGLLIQNITEEVINTDSWNATILWLGRQTSGAGHPNLPLLVLGPGFDAPNTANLYRKH